MTAFPDDAVVQEFLDDRPGKEVYMKLNKHVLPKRRIALIGDAAHQLPPAGGFGMNTAIQDAHNLAWKLAMIHRGQARRQLLSSYESERRPVAIANTALSLRNYEKTVCMAESVGLHREHPSPTQSSATDAHGAGRPILPYTPFSRSFSD